MARYCLLLLLLNILANFIDLSFTSPIPQQDIFSLYGMSQNQQQMSPLNQQNQLFGSPINGQQQQSSPFGQNPYQQMMPYGQQAMPVFHQDQQQLLALQRQQQNQLYAGGIYGSGKGLPYMQQQFSDGRMRATPNLANSGSPIPLSKFNGVGNGSPVYQNGAYPAVAEGGQRPYYQNTALYGAGDQIPVSVDQTSQSASSSSGLPHFLRGASQDVVDEYKRIIRTPNSTYESQVQKINKLVERLDEPAQGHYKEFMRENDERERIHRERVHKLVSELSEGAQEEFSKISAILRSQSEPDKIRWDRVLQTYAKMNPEMRNEFEQKFKNFTSTN